MEMTKHFVTFYSPGTFFAEQSTAEIESWDVNKAVEMSRSVVERYNAKPYGFQFTTRERGDDDFNSKETARSPMHYLGGRVWTLEEVKAHPEEFSDTLIRNMEVNGWDRIVDNRNSYRWTQPLEKNDIVLNAD